MNTGGLFLVLLFTTGCSAVQWSCQYDNAYDSRLTCSYAGSERFSTEAVPPAPKGVDSVLAPISEIVIPQGEEHPYYD